MRKFYFAIICLFGILCISSCGREAVEYDPKNPELEKGEGQLSLKSFALEVVQTKSPVTRVLMTDDYQVTLYDSNGQKVNEWAYKDVPEVLNLKAGSYSLSVVSHELKSLDTTPHYKGESEKFTVKANDITDVKSVICTMDVVEVMIAFDNSLLEYLDEKTVSVKLNMGTNECEYTGSDNLFPVYFAPVAGENNILNVTFKGTVDGYEEAYTATYTDLQAGDFHLIKFTLQGVNQDNNVIGGGSAFLKLKINSSCFVNRLNIDLSDKTNIAEEIIPEENPDDPNAGKKPTIEGESFDINEAQIVPADGMICRVMIKAPLRIAHLWVKIDSPTLNEDSMEGIIDVEFDLAYPATDKLKQQLQDLGLKTGSDVIGQTELVFDISKFTGLIPLLDNGIEHTHNFIITVEDMEGNELEGVLKLISSKQ